MISHPLPGTTGIDSDAGIPAVVSPGGVDSAQSVLFGGGPYDPKAVGTADIRPTNWTLYAGIGAILCLFLWNRKW